MTQSNQQNVPKLRFPEFDGAWDSRKVSDVFSVTRGQVLAVPKMTQEPSETTPYPVYSSQTKNNGLTGYYSDYLFENAVTWTTDGANAGDVRYRSGKFYCTNVCGVLLSEDGFANQFASESLNRITHKYVSYVGNPKLMNNVMGGIQYYLPTLPEQRKIASFLGAVDTKITQLAEKKRLLEDYKKGCMQQLFSQKIRFKDEDGKDFPDWEEKRLGEIFTWANTNSLSRERLTYEGGQVQNIHYGDIHTKFSANFHQEAELVPYIKDAIAADFKADQFCQVGDVVIADASEDYADIGKAIEIVKLGDVPLVAGLHTYIARPCKQAVETGFPGYLLRSAPMRRQIERIAQGISVLGISKRNLEKLTFFLPHPAEQRKIADFLSAIDRKIDLVGAELEHAKTFKKGLLQQMFV